MRLTLDFSSVGQGEASDFLRFSILPENCPGTSLAEIMLQLCYRVVLDDDDLVPLRHDLFQLLYLAEQDLNGVLIGDPRRATGLLWMEVWQLLIDLLVVRQYLADPIKVAVEQVVVRGHLERLARVVAPGIVRLSGALVLVACVAPPHVRPVCCDRARMPQVCRHHLLVALEGARVQALLHGLHLIVYAVM